MPPLCKRDCDSVASCDEACEDFGDGGMGGFGGEDDEEFGNGGMMLSFWEDFEPDPVNIVEDDDGSLHLLGGSINVLMEEDDSVNSMESGNSSDENLCIINNHLAHSNYECVPDSDVPVAD